MLKIHDNVTSLEENKTIILGGEMNQWESAPVAKPEDLSLNS